MMGNGPFQPTRPTNVDISAEPSKAHSFSMKKPSKFKICSTNKMEESKPSR